MLHPLISALILELANREDPDEMKHGKANIYQNAIRTRSQLHVWNKVNSIFLHHKVALEKS